MAFITQLSGTGFYELIIEHAGTGESWILFLDFISQEVRLYTHALWLIVNPHAAYEEKI